MTTNNKHNSPNVPTLRFPEFTEEWVNVSLKDVADFQKERISSGLLDESTYISTENILQNFQGVQSAISIPANTNVVAYKKNDILLSNIRPYLKKVWFSDKIGGCSADVFVLRSKTCEPEFLYNVIASDKFINYVMSGAKGVKMPRGDKNQMESFSFSIPAVAEQRKISRLFQFLDEKIATQNKIIERYESLIRGIVDTIILRKPQNAIIGDVCMISKQIRAESKIDDIITVRLHGNGVCKSNAESLQLGATQYYRRKAGQLIYGKQNFHNGAIGIIPKALDKGITSKDIPSFDIDNCKCNSTYLLAQLLSPKFYKPSEALTTGTGSKRLKEETFLKMPIVLPDKEEQDNIAALIDKITMRLDQAKRMLYLFSAKKQFLLRQMFI